MSFPRWIHWRAEGLRLRKQPLAWMALGALFLVLLACATSAGLQARAWREAAAQDHAKFKHRLEVAAMQLQSTPFPGPANAIATYQLGRGDLGLTRMSVEEGLALGVHRLSVLPTQVRASLESRNLEDRSPGPLRNPLLTETGLPGLPTMAALLISLVGLVLCVGLLQEEREQARLGLIHVQSLDGTGPILFAALGWRLLALWVVSATATLPALLLDPTPNTVAQAQWVVGLAVFCAVWVVMGWLISCVPVSSANALLLALGLWLGLTFAVPAGLVLMALREASTPSRLQSIVAIREAQHESEDREQALARAWYDEHPAIQAQLPAVWPASFVTRALDQDQALEPLLVERNEGRLQQAELIANWSWLSPGLALVLWGEKLAGTDAASHVHYLERVERFESEWRDFLVPAVMSRQGLHWEELRRLPQFQQKDRARLGPPEPLQP